MKAFTIREIGTEKTCTGEHTVSQPGEFEKVFDSFEDVIDYVWACVSTSDVELKDCPAVYYIDRHGKNWNVLEAMGEPYLEAAD